MAQLAMHRPLDEPDPDNDLWTHPVGAQPGQPFFREWRTGDLDGVEPRTERQQQFRIEARSNLSANTKSPFSRNPTSSAPSPTRLPCGSVNPPTTKSCSSSHFIFSQCGDRRCSSHGIAPPRSRLPSLHCTPGSRVRGRRASRSGREAAVVAAGPGARRSSSVSDRRSAPAIQTTSNTS